MSESLFVPPEGAVQVELIGLNAAIWAWPLTPLSRPSPTGCSCTQGFVIIQETTPEDIEWERETYFGGGIIMCQCHGRIIE